MRLNRLIFILVGCLVSLSASGGPDEWSIAKTWIGKYPSTQVLGRGVGLLAQPSIRASLRLALPKAEAGVLPLLTNESIVRDLDGYIVVNLCRPHNCPTEMATVVIDVDNKRLWVGFFAREDTRISTRWYGTVDNYSVLPTKILADFISRHGG